MANIPEPPYGAFGAPIQKVSQDLQDQLDRVQVLEDRQRLETFGVDIQGQVREGIMKIREAAAGEADPDKYQAIYDKGFPDFRSRS